MKLIPVALLGCLMMTGAVALGKGMLFRDLAADVRQREDKIEGLKAEIDRERHSALNRAHSASAKLAVENAALNSLQQVANTLTGQAAVIKDALVEIASAIKARERVERSLRSYEGRFANGHSAISSGFNFLNSSALDAGVKPFRVRAHKSDSCLRNTRQFFSCDVSLAVISLNANRGPHYPVR
ncbi:MAG: hypothetical protein ACJ746_02125 [Bryobacteraceae bacterium]